MRINWTIEFLCYCCVEFGISHRWVLSYSLFPIDWITAKEHRWTKQCLFWSHFFPFTFFSFSSSVRVNLCKNKSVFFSVRSAFVSKSGTARNRSTGEKFICVQHQMNEATKKNRTSIWRATKKMYLAIEGQRYETNSRNVSCTSLINIHFDGEYFYMSFDSAIVFAFDSGATNKASYLYMWSLVDESNDSSHFPCRLIIVWVVFFPLSFSFSNINSIVVYA